MPCANRKAPCQKSVSGSRNTSESIGNVQIPMGNMTMATRGPGVDSRPTELLGLQQSGQDGDEFKGKLSTDFDRTLEYPVNTAFIAHIISRKKTNLATGEQTTLYELLSLHSK